MAKSRSEFHRHGGRKDGLAGSCKQCACARSKRWHQENQERASEQKRQRRLENLEAVRARDRERGAQQRQTPEWQEYQRRWREEHREERREYERRWRDENPEKVKAHRQKSHAANRDERLAYMRERKRQQHERLEAYRREQGCVDCGTHEGRLEFDHRPGEVKSFNVTQGLGRAWEVIWAEILKCDVRCATCHRKRHAAVRAAA